MATALLVVMIRDRFRPGTHQVRGNSMDNQSLELIFKKQQYFRPHVNSSVMIYIIGTLMEDL
jgi:hypothetical protein